MLEPPNMLVLLALLALGWLLVTAVLGVASAHARNQIHRHDLVCQTRELRIKYMDAVRQKRNEAQRGAAPASGA